MMICAVVGLKNVRPSEKFFRRPHVLSAAVAVFPTHSRKPHTGGYAIRPCESGRPSEGVLRNWCGSFS
ncbi:hypothetical protein LVJ85_04640 [Neisseria sp. Dent CA1/247]|uniref:hypothetical protein n=1 Tax=Neisseria sp. Dent CA1/247 TaxID=2912675 RepID=UPI001FCFB526|nr:hypothetical protein [Neisseria sp. Dent CA1/247]UOO77762.1 hypothetical protein LVJ85_04640 [Neisseria sp. Dent CA1/247]